MFHTLVVPLDGSPLAERAVTYANRLAQASQARLVLVEAVPGGSADNDNAVADARTYLAALAERLSGQVAAVEITTPRGRPADRILETVDAYQADGVVMTTHGRTGVDHLLHGSVTEDILARSHVPVFVVYARPGAAIAPAFAPEYARLLVPQNGSEYDAPAVKAAVEMLGPYGEIVLVMVATPPDHVVHDYTGRYVLAYLDQQEEAITREAREYLTDVADPLREGPAPISIKIDVRLGDPATGIVTAAADSRANLIVMATHGRTGITRAVLGSVAGEVLRSATTPVVLVHPSPVPAYANLNA